MKLNDAIRAMLKAILSNQVELGEKLGMSAPALNRCINNNNVTVNRLWEMCDACGYEVVIRPKNKRMQNKDNTFTIEGETKADRAARKADELN